MADIKAELKAAREAIRAGSFQDALKHCKTIIREDPGNYNALVFAGAALEGLEQFPQSEQAYRKAIDVAPNSPLAWQGLEKLLEKQATPDAKSALVDVLDKLSDAFLAAGERQKSFDTLAKLVTACRALAKYHVAIKALQARSSALLSAVDGSSSSAPSAPSASRLDSLPALKQEIADLYLDWSGNKAAIPSPDTSLVAASLEDVVLASPTEPSAAVAKYREALLAHLSSLRRDALKAIWNKQAQPFTLTNLASATDKLTSACESSLSTPASADILLLLGYEKHANFFTEQSPSDAQTLASLLSLLQSTTAAVSSAASLLHAILSSPAHPPTSASSALESAAPEQREAWVDSLTKLCESRPDCIVAYVLLSRLHLLSSRFIPAVETINRGLLQCVPAPWANVELFYQASNAVSLASPQLSIASKSLISTLSISSASSSSSASAAPAKPTFANFATPDTASKYRAALEVLQATAYASLDSTYSDRALQLFRSHKAALQEASLKGNLLRDCLLGLAALELRLGEFAHAEAAYRTVLSEVDSSSVAALSGLGWALVCQHKAQRSKAAAAGGSDALRQACALLRDAHDRDKTRFQSHLYLACCIWEGVVAGLQQPDQKVSPDEPQIQECYQLLLNAAKLSPTQSVTFTYLGHYFLRAQSNTANAQRSYLKAVKLDPLNDEAGRCLSDLYVAQIRESWIATQYKEADKTAIGHAFDLHLEITKAAGVGRAPWAWLRLGIEQFSKSQFSDAIISFQSSLRGDTKNASAWRCLGDAYVAQGKYVASLRAFQKALELEPLSLYAVLQVAKIQRLLGMWNVAVKQYEFALGELEKQSSPSSWLVPALKGLAETLHAAGLNAIGLGKSGAACDYLLYALRVALKAVNLGAGLVCVRKLAGDIATSFHRLSLVDIHRVDVATFTAAEPKSESSPPSTQAELQSAVDKEILILNTGVELYESAAALAPQSPGLLNDIAVNLLWQHLVASRHCCFGVASPASSQSTLERALDFANRALKLAPSAHMFWNTSGVVAMSHGASKYALAQHCFLTSIALNANNAVAWTNLGLLYLRLSLIEPANHAFKIVQAMRPSHSHAWVGQALVAELYGMEEEAGDLFRHASELAQELEADAGYGCYAQRFFSDPQLRSSNAHLHVSLPAASTALGRFVAFEAFDPAALNTYGLLLEAQGLIVLAERQFSRALQVLGLLASSAAKQGSAADAVDPRHVWNTRLFTSAQDLDGKIVSVKTNLCRVWLKLGRTADALGMLQTFCDKATDYFVPASVGHAYFAQCQWKESLDGYRKALAQSSGLIGANLASSPVVQFASAMHVAMALCSYRLGDIESAKNSLFACLRVNPTNQYALLLMCTFGLLHSNLALATAALNDLKKVPHSTLSEATVCNAGYLDACLMLLQGNAVSARNRLSSLLLMYPHRAHLWASLSSFLVQYGAVLGNANGSLAFRTFQAAKKTAFLVQAPAVVCGSRFSSAPEPEPITGTLTAAGIAGVALESLGHKATTSSAVPTFLPNSILSAGYYVRKGQLQDHCTVALRAAQRNVFMAPASLANLASLASAVLAKELADGYSSATAPLGSVGAKLCKFAASKASELTAALRADPHYQALPLLQLASGFTVKSAVRSLLYESEFCVALSRQGGTSTLTTFAERAAAAAQQALGLAVSCQDVALAQLSQRQHARVLLLLATSSGDQGQGDKYSACLSALKEAAAVNVSDPYVWMDLASVYARLGKVVCAELCLRTALRNSPTASLKAAVLCRLCVLAERAGNRPLAFEAQSEASKCDSFLPMTQFLLGWILARQQQSASDSKNARRLLTQCSARASPPLVQLAEDVLKTVGNE